MAISSISLAYCYGGTSATAAAPAASAAAPAAARPDAAVAATADEHRGGRRHVMYDAMMAALQVMGLVGSAAPTGTAAAPTATPAAPGSSGVATASAGSTADTASHDKNVADAVLTFVQALGQALRGGSADTSSDAAGQAGGDAVDNPQHHHLRHERRQERREERRAERREDRRDGDGAHAYGGLADRLEALASKIRARAGTAAPAPWTPEPPVSIAAAQAASNATAVATPSSTAATTSTTSTVSVESKPASNVLVDAFGGLLSALKPPAGAVATAKDAAAQLSSFLHLLSQGLQPSANAPAHLHVGIMIDVTA